MPHCRMQNTAQDLQDCIDNWDLSDDVSLEEKEAQQNIINLAKEIIDLIN